MGTTATSKVKLDVWYKAYITHLAPDQHGAEDDLQTVKEVVSNDDDSSAPCCPAFTGTDGFDTRCSCSQTQDQIKEKKENECKCLYVLQHHKHSIAWSRSYGKLLWISQCKALHAVRLS